LRNCRPTPFEQISLSHLFPNSFGNAIVPCNSISPKTLECAADNPGRITPNVTLSTSKGRLSTPNRTLSVPNGTLRAPNETLSTPNGQLSTPNGNLSASNGRLSVPNRPLSVPNGRLSAPNRTLSAPNVSLSTPNTLLSASNPSIARDCVTENASKARLQLRRFPVCGTRVKTQNCSEELPKHTTQRQQGDSWLSLLGSWHCSVFRCAQ